MNIPEAGTAHHWSDCAVHNEPAMPNGPCDCGGNAPAQDEPVLWIDPDNLKCILQQGIGGALRYVMPKPERETDVPLYATHQSDKLRKAAEEVSSGLALWAGMNNTVPEWLREKLYVYAENLRAALEEK